MEDKNGEELTIETLRPGDIIGKESILFNREMLFCAVTKTPIKILKLTYQFLMECQRNFFGLE